MPVRVKKTRQTKEESPVLMQTDRALPVSDIAAASERAMPADPGGKSRSARQRLARGDHFEAAAHFVGDGVFFPEIPLPQRREPVGAHAGLREARDVFCK